MRFRGNEHAFKKIFVKKNIIREEKKCEDTVGTIGQHIYRHGNHLDNTSYLIFFSYLQFFQIGNKSKTTLELISMYEGCSRICGKVL